MELSQAGKYPVPGFQFREPGFRVHGFRIYMVKVGSGWHMAVVCMYSDSVTLRQCKSCLTFFFLLGRLHLLISVIGTAHVQRLCACVQ